ncbi:aminotransferase class I/II-fold pyridoxal phosphate-dependent enzyme [Alterisphingorhabdus coralli]|uniref:Pyridoxal phosphate-dependent aminotransferase family protein n=1 Tax=Alterisphingorhabdus coralli TaxID=3071408 RepID=A0AA97FAH5_9SPHN|nr:pyridoxal phosphate-dependent aminotransferase family protein [Parasphingorhabdus sp. SCSIO 66989]WOE75505.1 pyridoxal phosphate-dependent aminotransferase family protein [Parasphingorhabdus sp. SCSIO 66989]
MSKAAELEDFALYGGPVKAEVILDGKEVVNYGGCSYLGLTGHPVAEAAATKALEQYGLAASIARAYGVANPVLLELEQVAARFFGTEAAFCAAAGYLASPLAISALTDTNTRLYVDQVCHHSLVFGAQATGQPIERYTHNLGWDDPEALRDFVLQTLRPGEKPLFAMDGITGLLGDISPVPEFVRLADEFDGIVYVDDAHAVGVLGDNGRGTAEYFGIDSDRVCFGATFSKALGGLGGVIFGPEHFVARARSSAMARGSNLGSIPHAAAAIALMEHLMADKAPIQKLHRNIRVFKTLLQELGVSLPAFPTSISSFAFGSYDDHAAMQRNLLQDHGIFLCHSNYTGAGPEGLIRIAVFADHSDDHLDHLIRALTPYLSK